MPCRSWEYFSEAQVLKHITGINAPQHFDTAHPNGSEKLLLIPSEVPVKSLSPHQLPEQLTIFKEQSNINQVSRFPYNVLLQPSLAALNPRRTRCTPIPGIWVKLLAQFFPVLLNSPSRNFMLSIQFHLPLVKFLRFKSFFFKAESSSGYHFQSFCL